MMPSSHPIPVIPPPPSTSALMTGHDLIGSPGSPSLAALGFVDITELILSDHHEQRRMFAMLDDVDPSDTDTLAGLWGRVSAMLETHARAEEEIFYPEL